MERECREKRLEELQKECERLKKEIEKRDKEGEENRIKYELESKRRQIEWKEEIGLMAELENWKKLKNLIKKTSSSSKKF